VVPGTSRRSAPVPRLGAGASPPTASTPWASASVSDHQQASRRSEDSGSRRAERSLRGERPEPSGAPFFLPNPSIRSTVADAWVSPADQDLPQYSGRTRQPYGKETECSYIESPLSRDAPAEGGAEIFVLKEWLPENRRKEAIKTLNLSSLDITSPIIANSQTPLSNT